MINRKQLCGEMFLHGSDFFINVAGADTVFVVKQCMFQYVNLFVEEWQGLDSSPCLLNGFS